MTPAPPQSRARDTPVEWYTPPDVFAALGLAFDLDPCSPPLPAARWLPVRNRVSLPEDGLAADWQHFRFRAPLDPDPRPRVWLNPPYGDQCGRWVMKLAAHGRGIALVFCRTDTAWWQRSAAAAHAVCFIEGRVNFIPGHRDGRGASASTAPSCLLAYGETEAAAVLRAGLGIVVLPNGRLQRPHPEPQGAFC